MGAWRDHETVRQQSFTALAFAITAATVLLTAGCGGSSPPAGQASPTPSALTCTASGPASASWPAAASAPSTAPIVSAVVAGDTLTLTFVQGTPAFEVTSQATTHFIETGGRGGPVDLAGSAGALIILRGFRGDVRNYTGPLDLTPGGALLLEVREIGDFEGVIGWAAGLSKAGCASVTAGTSTLTFHFIAGPA
jgi:hypothetical protein